MSLKTKIMKMKGYFDTAQKDWYDTVLNATEMMWLDETNTKEA